MKLHSVLTASILAACVGCAQVPTAAVDVNRQVGTGISTLGENGLSLIEAWEEMGMAMIDERWSQVYRKADDLVRKRESLAAGAVLNARQQEAVAGVATLIRDEMRKKVRDEAEAMRRTVAGNMKTTLDANQSITSLLASANGALASQQAALQQVGTLLRVPASYSKLIDEHLKK